MSKAPSNGSVKAKLVNGHQAVLEAIDDVIDLCSISRPDAAIERAVRELQAIKSAVQAQWPLPSDVKRKIDLGPFAAKNISDLNSTLADTLMRLDHSLQDDGKSVDRVIASPKPSVEMEHAAALA